MAIDVRSCSGERDRRTEPKPTLAHCTYPAGSTDLVCEFQNPGKHASVTDGMIVPRQADRHVQRHGALARERLDDRRRRTPSRTLLATCAHAVSTAAVAAATTVVTRAATARRWRSQRSRKAGRSASTPC